jgi:cyclomaltodextrinase / maltogenic alpha-amylase / neopullulanase
MQIQTPEWVKQAVFYQIFPDRFARNTSRPTLKGVQFKEWGSPPEEQGFQGGDLYGVAEKLDYLQKLGITAIYLNPIFSSAANHRYHTYDYFQVDPLLGGDQALRVLLDEAHKRSMRIILDGVFNHCGRGFWAFHHLLENGAASPYANWFTVYDYPLRPYLDTGILRAGKARPNYACWWGIPALPKFNIANSGVREYLLRVARYWLEFGIDGWRLDVPEEIQDDSFWREFRQVVKTANPEAYIVGEVWHPAQHYLQGDMFDGVMNYIITGPILSFFGASSLNPSWQHSELKLQPMDGLEFAENIEQMLSLYDWQVHFTQLNMLDSHDMPRALWLLGGDKNALRLSVLCQMTMPGAPCVYYGDEVGLSAGGDPHCREAFPWHQSERWDQELLTFYQSAIALRKAHPALQTGAYRLVHAVGRCVVYLRSLAEQSALVAFNAGVGLTQIDLPFDELQIRPAGNFSSVWPPGLESSYQMQGNSLHLELAPQSALVLVAET